MLVFLGIVLTVARFSADEEFVGEVLVGGVEADARVHEVPVPVHGHTVHVALHLRVSEHLVENCK